MNKNKTLAIALAALFSTSLALADSEVSGKLVLEQSSLQTGTGSAIKDEMKFRLYADGDISQSITYHAELQGTSDPQKIGYTGEYSQNADLREFYLDIDPGEGWTARVGKQQVVWGTADGMKLLDTINPTDYSEMAQNQMEDSRIPVLMVNLEKSHADGGSSQIIISDAQGNNIAGLGNSSETAAYSHTNGDTGNSFLMKGVDSITGQRNGFVNVAPALGGVASFFTFAGGANAFNEGLYGNYQGATVSEFVNSANDGMNFWGLCGALTNASDAACLANVANTMAAPGYNGPDAGEHNLIGATNAEWGVGTDANSAFEFMDQATFATFYSFHGLKTKYLSDRGRGEFKEANVGLRYSGATKGGLNYSVNYLDHLDSNPSITTKYEDALGNALKTQYSDSAMVNMGGTVSAGTGTHTTVTLMDADDSQHYTTDYNGGTGNGEGSAVLVMTETHERIKTIGGSFDTSFESAALGPVVIRGEATFDQGVMTPVVNLAALQIGDMIQGLTMKEGERFSYVLGADITVLTNMMISGQIIGINNLDFIDTTSTSTDDYGNTSVLSGAEYTGDMATMSMENNFNKGIKNKNFYSLFFSKPFGASGQHRWNNIVMVEEGTGSNGYWNRFDVSYGLTDDVESTVEFNNYWGNDNTQFGQFKDSSNMQVGVKYSF